jgi:large subunit ribosomal protein L18
MAETLRRKLRLRRRKHTRKQLRFCERPLLTVYRSSKHIYAQIDDPISGKTLTAASTRTPAVREGLKSTKGKDAAKRVGETVARLAMERQITEVALNRNGFHFTGRVKALADAAREAGLRF